MNQTEINCTLVIILCAVYYSIIPMAEKMQYNFMKKEKRTRYAKTFRAIIIYFKNKLIISRGINDHQKLIYLILLLRYIYITYRKCSRGI